MALPTYHREPEAPAWEYLPPTIIKTVEPESPVESATPISEEIADSTVEMVELEVLVTSETPETESPVESVTSISEEIIGTTVAMMESEEPVTSETPVESATPISEEITDAPIEVTEAEVPATSETPELESTVEPTTPSSDESLIIIEFIEETTEPAAPISENPLPIVIEFIEPVAPEILETELRVETVAPSSEYLLPTDPETPEPEEPIVPETDEPELPVIAAESVDNHVRSSWFPGHVFNSWPFWLKLYLFFQRWRRCWCHSTLLGQLKMNLPTISPMKQPVMAKRWSDHTALLFRTVVLRSCPTRLTKMATSLMFSTKEKYKHLNTTQFTKTTTDYALNDFSIDDPSNVP